MVFVAMRKPHSCRGGAPHIPGLYGTFTETFLRAADLWKSATFWKAANSRPRKRVAGSIRRGKHDSVAAADGPAADNRGVNADVYCVVLSSRAEDS
jgi:hypothetical protein